ncbi:hypothetical protein WMY93_019219 [Mugilogobius chulae]|uniref:Uncharacterized protein n=1 Tax=Mugilogobius chulae TaxID=88201 RepID=A0AAW0NDP5_9GOBI
MAMSGHGEKLAESFGTVRTRALRCVSHNPRSSVPELHVHIQKFLCTHHTGPDEPVKIRNGNLKSILGLFFILSRYKQQQQQQQQYYQSLVELSQNTSPSASSGQGQGKASDMQTR